MSLIHEMYMFFFSSGYLFSVLFYLFLVRELRNPLAAAMRYTVCKISSSRVICRVPLGSTQIFPTLFLTISNVEQRFS